MTTTLPQYRRFSIKSFEVRDSYNIDEWLTKLDVDGDDVVSIILTTNKTGGPYYKVFYKAKVN